MQSYQTCETLLPEPVGLPEPLLPVLWLITATAFFILFPTAFVTAEVTLCTLLVLAVLDFPALRPTFGEGTCGTLEAAPGLKFFPMYDLVDPDTPPDGLAAGAYEGRLLEILEKELLRLSLGVVWVDVARCDILLSSRVLKWYGGAEV